MDALRGVAALAVLLQHLLSLTDRDAQPWAHTIITTIDLGKFGVALFFLISGFVIPISLRRGLGAFWLGRAFRLLPALWLSMALALALGRQFSGVDHALANAFMLTGAVGQSNLVSVYWTLNWELYFYLVLSICVAAQTNLRAGTLGVLALIFAFGSLVVPFLTYLVLMLTGALWRLVAIEKDEAARGWLAAALGAFMAALFLWFQSGARPPEFFVGIVLAVAFFALMWNRITHPIAIWLGGISYSLYLLHLPILERLTGLPFPIYATVGIALSLTASWLAYILLERPMIAIGKRLSAPHPHTA